MARKKLPTSWQIVGELQTYSDKRPSPARLDELLEKYTAEELQQREQRILYRMGYISIPRALLEDERYINLRPGTKSVFYWLMIKAEIIRQKKKAGVEDEETRRLPWITATGKEIKFYAGIKSKDGTRHISEHTDALKAAGLIDTREEKTGGRTEAKLYRIEALEIDYKGYFKAPIKVFLTPQFTRISHTAKALYMIMLSQNQLAQVKTKQTFPVFRVAYSQMKKYGVKGYKTISDGINELENYELITVDRGVFIKSKDKKSDNSYTMTTGIIYDK